MVREGVVLEHLVLGKGLEVDKAKIEVIQNHPLPHGPRGSATQAHAAPTRQGDVCEYLHMYFI